MAAVEKAFSSFAFHCKIHEKLCCRWVANTLCWE